MNVEQRLMNNAERLLINVEQRSMKQNMDWRVETQTKWTGELKRKQRNREQNGLAS